MIIQMNENNFALLLFITFMGCFERSCQKTLRSKCNNNSHESGNSGTL